MMHKAKMSMYKMNYYFWIIFKYEDISIEITSLPTNGEHCLLPTEKNTST